MKKRLSIFILVLLLLATNLTYADKPTEIFVKGEILPGSFEIKNIGGHTFVPIRYVGESFNFDIGWNQAKREILASKGDRSLRLYPNSKIAYANNKKIELPVSPYIKDGVTYVPTRFISENLGIELHWDNKHRLVLIGEKDVERIANGKAYTMALGKYSLDIPAEIVDEVLVIQGRRFVHVCEKSNYMLYENQGKDSFPFGTIFTIDIDTNSVRGDMVEGEKLYYYDDEHKTFVSIGGPTDVQFDVLNKERIENYARIKSYEDQIIKSFRKN